MKLRQGQRIKINCPRKGTYNAVSLSDQDTDAVEFLDVAVDQAKPVEGMTKSWGRGQTIPCRASNVTITLR
jgi:hypothetical protein